MNSAWLSVLVALLKLAVWLVQALERAKLKAEGRIEADEEANAEQKRRIELAKAAGDDADRIAAGGLPDPWDRDNSVR